MDIQPYDIRPNDLGIYKFRVLGLTKSRVTEYASFRLPQVGNELIYSGVRFKVVSVQCFSRHDEKDYIGTMMCELL